MGCPYFSSPGWEEVLILKPYFTHPQKCALFGGANWGCTRVQKVVHLDFENWGVRKNDKTVLLSIVGANYDSFLNKKKSNKTQLNNLHIKKEFSATNISEYRVPNLNMSFERNVQVWNTVSAFFEQEAAYENFLTRGSLLNKFIFFF